MKNLLNQSISLYKKKDKTNNQGQHNVEFVKDTKCRIVRKSTTRLQQNGDIINISYIMTTSDKVIAGNIVEYEDNFYEILEVNEWRNKNKIFGYYSTLFLRNKNEIII
jgi:hypothetical protein